MQRPQRGRIGGRSKYYPKAMKPLSEEKRKDLLEFLTEKHKDVPDDVPNVKTRFDADDE